jgi:hypothetical protein
MAFWPVLRTGNAYSRNTLEAPVPLASTAVPTRAHPGDERASSATSNYPRPRPSPAGEGEGRGRRRVRAGVLAGAVTGEGAGAGSSVLAGAGEGAGAGLRWFGRGAGACTVGGQHRVGAGHQPLAGKVREMTLTRKNRTYGTSGWL